MLQRFAMLRNEASRIVSGRAGQQAGTLAWRMKTAYCAAPPANAKSLAEAAIHVNARVTPRALH
ncbi:hypothetical protein QCE63_11955 [Caballeronia sp. LZ065]|uniref:hypothetical protein n=1 Tax=Caballeronia sp. LZ065 TaxID=3038571 RepID=UPI0028643075|nr:hypothetical protein [Caballeronia sp. LZ065]MDR5780134.1 hypothetical protein [Caballeronia sp. LZ065]